MLGSLLPEVPFCLDPLLFTDDVTFSFLNNAGNKDGNNN
jgi:hypothetical protein